MVKLLNGCVNKTWSTTSYSCICRCEAVVRPFEHVVVGCNVRGAFSITFNNVVAITDIF